MSGIVKPLLWSFLEQGSAKLVALIVQIVLARLLTPEAFGVLAILLVVTQVADSIAQSGLGMALIQKTDADANSYSTGWWLSLGIAVLLYIIILLSAPLLASFYNMAELCDYLRVLGVVVILNSANSIQRSFLQKQLDFRGIFRVSLIAIILSGAVGICFAYIGFGVWALVMQSVAQSAFTLIAMLFVVPWKPSLVFNRNEAHELFSYGWKICVTGILGVLYTGLSELVIGRTCSAGELGFYSQGRKYPMAVIHVATHAIQNVMFPALAEKKEDREAFKAAARFALCTGTCIIAPLSFCVAAMAEPLVGLLLTDTWLPCVPVFQMVCISHSIMLMTIVNLRAYMALGDSMLYMKLQMLKTAIGSIAICATAIFTQDIYLTAFATFLTTLFNSAIIDSFPANRLYGYSTICQLKDIMPSIILSCVAAILTYIIGEMITSYVLAIVVQLFIFMLVYIFGSRAFKLKAYKDLVRFGTGLINRNK